MRYPSARGVGVRYLIAVLLPFSGICLVVYTAVQLAIAHATNTHFQERSFITLAR